METGFEPQLQTCEFAPFQPGIQRRRPVWNTVSLQPFPTLSRIFAYRHGERRSKLGRPQFKSEAAALGVRYNAFVGSRTGRPPRSFWQEGEEQLLFPEWAGRKVRTPQSTVPDNVRDARFKPGGRKVPQKTYRPGGNTGVRVKRCGKSAPPRQQCCGHGKPHTEQDQIGRKFRGFGRGYVPARCVKPSGRSLEPRSNARPRGMAVPQAQSCGQNSAYRSGCHKSLFSIAYRTPNTVVAPL
jgi:hypothetical protein